MLENLPPCPPEWVGVLGVRWFVGLLCAFCLVHCRLLSIIGLLPARVRHKSPPFFGASHVFFFWLKLSVKKKIT